MQALLEVIHQRVRLMTRLTRFNNLSLLAPTLPFHSDWHSHVHLDEDAYMLRRGQSQEAVLNAFPSRSCSSLLVQAHCAWHLSMHTAQNVSWSRHRVLQAAHEKNRLSI